MINTDWREVPPGEVAYLSPGARVFQRTLTPITALQVIVSQDDGAWHLSLSHRTYDQHGRTKPGRLPTYEELKEARYRFVPDDVTMAQLFPPSADWVNVHETTLHLWQVPSDTGSDA